MLSRVSSCWSRSQWTAEWYLPAPVSPRVRHGFRVRLVVAILFPLLSPQLQAHSLRFFFSPLSGPSEAYAGNVQYVYDDLGRLIAVVDDATGEAAIYQYDAVGNLLGIVRQPASTVSILNFTPKSGPVGTTVTVSGTGYSATASQNTVTFNGTPATVTSATTTQLVVAVPAGATTGPIAVTTPTGSATSSTPFTVTSGGVAGAPTITSFTPTIGTVGTPVTITGTNFDPVPANDSVRFNLGRAVVASATSSTLTTSVPPVARSGRITVGTAAGQAVSTTDFFAPPPPYTPASIEFMDRMAVGQSKTITITAAGKNALIVFEGTVGQRLSFKITNKALNLGSITFYYPDGTLLMSYSQCANPIPANCLGINASAPLAVSGTYTIVVDPLSNYTGSLTLTLYDVPPDPTGIITIDGPSVPLPLLVPGQKAELTFSGTAGQRISLGGSVVAGGAGFGTWTRVMMLNPDDSTLVSDTLTNDFHNNGGGSLDAQLPVTGTYRIIIDPKEWNTLTFTATLSTELMGPIMINGPSIPLTYRVGQNARLTFTGTAGQTLGLGVRIQEYLYCCSGKQIYMLIYNPAGTVLTSFSFDPAIYPTGNEMDMQLPVDGTYTIFIYLTRSSIGTLVATLSTELTGSIVVDGPSLPLSIRSGQNVRLTFDGTSGQKLSLGANAVALGPSTQGRRVTVYNPDGTTLQTIVRSGESAVDFPVLPATGVYTLFLGLHVGDSGTLTQTLSTELTGTLTLGAAAVPVTISRPGQNARFTFTGTANQQVTVRVTGNTINSVTVKLLKPDGTTQTYNTSSAASFNLAQQTLATTGTYTVTVDPPEAKTGSLNVQVTSP